MKKSNLYDDDSFYFKKGKNLDYELNKLHMMAYDEEKVKSNRLHLR